MITSILRAYAITAGCWHMHTSVFTHVEVGCSCMHDNNGFIIVFLQGYDVLVDVRNSNLVQCPRDCYKKLVHPWHAE